MKKHGLSLVLDGNNFTARIEKTPVVPVVQDGEVRRISIKPAANGGFSVDISFQNSKGAETLVFSSATDLIDALGQILK